jgi:outer membrane immunogenic protein
MRTYALSSALAATALCFAAPALASDLGMPAELRPSTFDISLGVFGAGTSVKSDYVGTANEFSEFPYVISGNLDGTAYGLGLRGSVDYGTGGWIVGLVGDWTFGGQVAEDDYYSMKLQMPNLGTLRARAGGTYGSALFYLTGGLAQAQTELEVDWVGSNESQSTWTKGWTVGAGVDYALTEAVSIGAEYLYIGLDDVEYTITDLYGQKYHFEQDLDGIHSFRLGVNYTFQI